MTLFWLSGSAIFLSLVLHFTSKPSDLIAFAGDSNPVQHNFTTTKILRHSRYPVYAVTFSPDGQTLASAGYDDIIGSDREGTIKLWNLHTGKLLSTLSGHTDQVRSVAISPDGTILASGSDDKTIKLWNLKTGKLLNTLTGHLDWIASVAISRDGNTLASGSFDNTIKLWDLHTGKLLNILSGHSEAVQSVAFSPDGKILASGSNDKTVKLWNLTTGKLQNILTGHSNLVLSVVFSPDGKTLVSSGYDKTIKVWNLPTNCTGAKPCSPTRTLRGHSDIIPSLAISPDGTILASINGAWDNTIKLWNLSNGEWLRDLKGHSSEVVIKGETLAFSPDGRFLVSATNDGLIEIWREGAR